MLIGYTCAAPTQERMHLSINLTKFRHLHLSSAPFQISEGCANNRVLPVQQGGVAMNRDRKSPSNSWLRGRDVWFFIQPYWTNSMKNENRYSLCVSHVSIIAFATLPIDYFCLLFPPSSRVFSSLWVIAHFSSLFTTLENTR